MDNNSPGPMTPFDELVSSPQLQIMKLMIPYAPAHGRRALAACVKFMELRETLRVFDSGYGGIRAQMFGDEEPLTPLDMLNSFRPYLGPRETAALDMVINLREMMSVMQMMQNVSSPGASGEEGPAFDPMDLLAGMLSPEQQEMFKMYSEMFSHTADSSTDGNDVSTKKEDDVSAQEDIAANLPTETENSLWKGDDIGGRMDEQSGDKELRPGETGTDQDGGLPDER